MNNHMTVDEFAKGLSVEEYRAWLATANRFYCDCRTEPPLYFVDNKQVTEEEWKSASAQPAQP